MDDVDLKPCPFCGGKGFMCKSPDLDFGDFYSIECQGCRARSPEFHANETCPIFFGQVRDAWNARVDLAKPKVKPLVWMRNGNHWAGGYGYVIRSTGKRFTLTCKNSFGTDFETIEEAQAEAFSRHELETLKRLEALE